jgi:hypothetical protein
MSRSRDEPAFRLHWGMGETRVRSKDWGVPPWLGAYSRPTRTLRAILDEDPRRHVTLLVAIASLALAIVLSGLIHGPSHIWEWFHSAGQAPGYWPQSVIGATFTLTLAVFPLAWLSLHVIAAATWWFGRQLGGTGRLVEIRCALAWSVGPAFALAVMAVVAMAGMDLLAATWGPSMGAVIGAGALVGAALVVIVFLAEAHRFTMGGAVATVAFVVASLVLLGRIAIFIVGTRRFLDCVGLLSHEVSRPW